MSGSDLLAVIKPEVCTFPFCIDELPLSDEKKNQSLAIDSCFFGEIFYQALKAYIWLQCSDGSIQQVEEEVAMFCPMICREIMKNGAGSSKSHAILLPERVNPASLSLVLDYCGFHQVSGRSNKVHDVPGDLPF
jgi:hypothetical protein